jgi:pimeloyl-ACP methyl ester carboxylesterase
MSRAGPREVSFLLPDEENGVRRICAVMWGTREQQPCILCIHGFQDNANSFFFLAPRLASMGFFVVCVELTGHGRSDHGLSNYFSYAFDVVDVADSLQLAQFHLIGHSMGAIISSLVAGSLRQRVLSLVMIDAIGTVGTRHDSEAPELLETALNQRSAIISRRPRVYDTFEECLQRWAESPFAPRGEENIRLIVARGTEEIVNPNGFVTGFRFRHDPRLKMAPPFKMSESASQGESVVSRVPALKYLQNF